MSRKAIAVAGVFLLLGGLAMMPANAGTPKVVVVENYGATW